MSLNMQNRYIILFARRVCILTLFLSNGFVLFAKEYDVKSFGAIGDGKSKDTDFIQAAIDQCSSDGGGTVHFPAGKYVSGTIVLKNNVILNIGSGAYLIASTDPVDFPRQPNADYRSQKDPGGWYALIFAAGANHIGISGNGSIDGNGSSQLPRPGALKDDRDGRPRNILFISCRNVTVEGVHMFNSGLWNQHYLDCEDIHIEKITVYNHANRNNDALDIDGCRRVVVANSIFDSDDDAIVLKSTGNSETENIVISNCIISSFCNAIKAGTESTGGFRNITISNCTITPSKSLSKPIFSVARTDGITAISLEIVDGGVMEGVNINNITVEGTECPIYIRLGDRGRKYVDNSPVPGVGKMRNINISNLIAYNAGNFSSSVSGIPGHYIENLTMSNIQIFNRGGLKDGEYISDGDHVIEDEKGYPMPTVWGNLPSYIFFIRHAKNVRLSGFTFASENPDPRIPILAMDVEKLFVNNATFAGKAPHKIFASLKNVTQYYISKPLGWGKGKYIRKT